MLKTLWGVRHTRWLWYRWRVNRWAMMWGQMGIGLGFPNESDERWLKEIWEGRA